MHCVSRNSECPALSVENRLPVQPLSLSSGEEPEGHWLSPDRTKLDLLDSEQEKGGHSDLIWCQALETGTDRMEQVRLCHSLCSLGSHLSGYERGWEWKIPWRAFSGSHPQSFKPRRSEVGPRMLHF